MTVSDAAWRVKCFAEGRAGVKIRAEKDQTQNVLFFILLSVALQSCKTCFYPVPGPNDKCILAVNDAIIKRPDTDLPHIITFHLMSCNSEFHRDRC